MTHLAPTGELFGNWPLRVSCLELRADSHSKKFYLNQSADLIGIYLLNSRWLAHCNLSLPSEKHLPRGNTPGSWPHKQAHAHQQSKGVKNLVTNRSVLPSWL